MRYAVYDIGSNSVKFLAVDTEGAPEGAPFRILSEHSKTTRLAEDLIASCELKAEAVDRTLQAFAKLRAEADALGIAPENSRAVATSAVRDARNRKAFLKAAAAPEALGFPVAVLSGEEEAEGVYRGVRSDPLFRGRDLLAIDVGGGSAEWIRGEGGRIGQRISLPLGCVRLRERFVTGYPIAAQERNALDAALRAQLEEALADYPLQGREVVGTGGTITAAAAIDLGLKEYDPEKVCHRRLSRQRLDAMAGELGALDLDRLEHVTGLPPKRADIIVPGLAVFAASLRVLGADALTVSVRGLRYGVLDALLNDAPGA